MMRTVLWHRERTEPRFSRFHNARVWAPRTSGAFTPDPKRRGNPDHQIHLLMLEHATGGIPEGRCVARLLEIEGVGGALSDW